ncbi:MAG TPA: hypothetical protein VG328_03980 [Stellaceae bacterium]|jgi:glycosyltransferase involved in cell wall biosynthesis|nr:hypothetical protein [Stellaceae bacterium]
MKRLAIVSSYNEECGVAFYSSRLKPHLIAAGYQVDVKRLPLSLLRISHPAAIRRKGDDEIKRIAREIADYDAVLLQFEPGLYGSSSQTSYRRVAHLLKHAKQAIITVHGFDRAISAGSLPSLVLGGRFDIALGEVARFASSNRVRSFWHYVASAKHVSVMTFCRGDQTILERFYDMPRITSFPITYFDEGEVSAIRSASDRERVLQQFGLDPRKKYFSVCGFLSPYKGHLTAIKALEFLPDDWHLAIVGGEHPHGIEAGRDIGNYVRQLLAFLLETERPNGKEESGLLTNSDLGELMTHADLERIDIRKDILKRSEFKHFLPRKELRQRVNFLGQVSDEQMPQLYAALDYFVHPYMKTVEGQSGSGPATMALEFGTRSLFSNAPVFREMNLYFDGAMQFFNIGNFVELAESLSRFGNFENDLRINRERALKRYNPAAMVNTYRELLAS